MGGGGVKTDKDGEKNLEQLQKKCDSENKKKQRQKGEMGQQRKVGCKTKAQRELE